MMKPGKRFFTITGAAKQRGVNVAVQADKVQNAGKGQKAAIAELEQTGIPKVGLLQAALTGPSPRRTRTERT